MDPKFLKDIITSNFINQVTEYAIFVMDVNGVIVSWNEGAERMKGYKENEAIGSFYGMLFTEEDQQNGLPNYQLKQTEKQKHFEDEGWRRKKDGSLFWAGVALTAIYDDKGELLGFTKVTKDLTEKKKAEEELKYKNEELEKINQDLDTFIYTASHDLKAPILNIDGLIQRLVYLFEEKSINDPELEELIYHIYTSVSRFQSTIEDLTTISRLQRSLEIEKNDEAINVPDIYADIMADIGYMYDQAQFPCRVNEDFQVKTLHFSRKNFRSILYNLLSNAVKYRADCKDCMIDVKTVKEGDYVVLTVKDNGLGMSARNQKQLFTMFKRFHDHVQGSGIGLYIIKKIIDNAGGRVEVNSKVGDGSEFKVYLKSQEN